MSSDEESHESRSSNDSARERRKRQNNSDNEEGPPATSTAGVEKLMSSHPMTQTITPVDNEGNPRKRGYKKKLTSKAAPTFDVSTCGGAAAVNAPAPTRVTEKIAKRLVTQINPYHQEDPLPTNFSDHGSQEDTSADDDSSAGSGRQVTVTTRKASTPLHMDPQLDVNGWLLREVPFDKKKQACDYYRYVAGLNI